jgi:uncharacterized membrane protein
MVHHFSLLHLIGFAVFLVLAYWMTKGRPRDGGDRHA